MVRVTEQAATALEKLLAEKGAPPDEGVRLLPRGVGNLGMTIDAPHDGDEVISRNGEKPLLIVDGGVAERLTEMIVDFQDAADDHQTPGGFTLRPKLTDE